MKLQFRYGIRVMTGGGGGEAAVPPAVRDSHISGGFAMHEAHPHTESGWTEPNSMLHWSGVKKTA